MTRKILIPNYGNEASYPYEVLSGYNHLIQKIPTTCDLFWICGLESAVTRLPNNFIIKYKYQLVNKVEAASYKKRIDRLLLESEYLDFELLTKDSLILLSADEFRVYYDYDIVRAIDCFSDISLSNYPIDQLRLYRHIQLFMKILGVDNLNRLYIYSFSLNNFKEAFFRKLNIEEQNSIDMFYGLSSGYPKPLYIVENELHNSSSSNKCIKDISNGIHFLQGVQDQFIKKNNWNTK